MKPQAVIFIHGIGEQMPISTLRRFVHAVWLADVRSHNPFMPGQIWAKPDPISGNVALPRLSTNANVAGVRTDFFEFYWAHLMTETKLWHVLAWARVLMFRWPWTLSRRLFWLWLFLVSQTIVVLLVVVRSYDTTYAAPSWFPTVAALTISSIVDVVVLRTLGDAARYLHRTAQNTGRRVEILTKGVELLRAVQDSGRYDRVIVVGHSLGSVIAYDILTYGWTLYHAQHGIPETLDQSLDEIERLAYDTNVDVEQYQGAQRAFHHELRSNGSGWLVTDFITLGSPLTYGAVLLCRDVEELRSRQREREFPTCPPVLEGRRFSFRDYARVSEGNRRTIRFPNHAAVFAATCWTNIYFTWDIVAGPLQSVFGRGIRDIAVRTKWWLSPISHTRYWWLPKQESDVPDAVRELRRALNLTAPRAQP